ncbi:hypothetical protein K439DRAFT_1623944 [Ramaria rubella]|nr:hypothetical protein K439DRAFT_1623944 [Ramaria rubella]
MNRGVRNVRRRRWITFGNTLESSREKLDELEKRLGDAEEINVLQKKNHALVIRVRRFLAQKSLAVKTALAKTQGSLHMVKEKGVIKDTFRDLVLDLVADGVGSNMLTQLSNRWPERVSRIVLEGGVASKMQIVDCVERSTSITYSGDGTTHKNNNNESRHINAMDPAGGRTRLFLGVHSAVNHTSETQLTGLQTQLNDLYSTYNGSMQGANKKADKRDFAIKLKGVNTDHAADQKQLAQLLREWKTQCEREIRGEQSLLALAPESLLPLLFEATERAITAAGGPQGWDALPQMEKEEQNAQTYQDICLELGNEAFAKLTDTEKEVIDWFVWCGCCMHKELNMVKGGAGPACVCATDVSQGGAVKATSLAGTVFHHKDDKKGQQDSLKFFFEDMVGYTISFPDMSNTHYQSHCEAASKLLVHQELYIQFLEIVKDKKDTRALNHIEQNVYTALKDLPTIHELCALALFSQSISHPYMWNVRGPGQENTNVLDMGPLHQAIHTFMLKIIKEPDILLSAGATYTTASFDGKPWDRPEVFYAIQRLAPTLPYLSGVVVAFFESGKIANAPVELRQATWMPTTNDVNEGALGSYRVAIHCYPSISQHQFNARTCFKRNHTSAYMKASLTTPDHQHLCQQAHTLDEQSLEKKRWREQASYDRGVVNHKHSQDVIKLQKRNTAVAKLAAVTPILEIKQLMQFSKYLPRKKEVLTKALKIQALQQAVTSFQARQHTESGSRGTTNVATAELELDEYTDEE